MPSRPMTPSPSPILPTQSSVHQPTNRSPPPGSTATVIHDKGGGPLWYENNPWLPARRRRITHQGLLNRVSSCCSVSPTDNGGEGTVPQRWEACDSTISTIASVIFSPSPGPLLFRVFHTRFPVPVTGRCYFEFSIRDFQSQSRAAAISSFPYEISSPSHGPPLFRFILVHYSLFL
jgi:hypothetical protein